MEENPAFNMIDKLLENQYLAMFQLHNVDGDEDGLTLTQFESFVYAIGMEFIVTHFNSAKDDLFENNERVNFEDFMKYLRKSTCFSIS